MRVRRKRNEDRAKEIAKQEARKKQKKHETNETKETFTLEVDAAI